MNNLPQAEIFNIKNTIPLKQNHTISKSIFRHDEFDITLFSLAKNTDISEEFYSNQSIFLLFDGNIDTVGLTLEANSLFLTDKNMLRGVEANKDSIYLEIILKGEDDMKNIEKGQIINLKNSIDYVEGGISNLDIVNKKDLKIMLMAMDKGESLSAHSAPGDAMVIALEGSATLTVGEDDFTIKAGEQLIFPKDIIHNVTATEKYKMALILVIDND